MCVHMQQKPWKDGVQGEAELLPSDSGAGWQEELHDDSGDSKMGKQSQQGEVEASRTSYNPPFKAINP